MLLPAGKPSDPPEAGGGEEGWSRGLHAEHGSAGIVTAAPCSTFPLGSFTSPKAPLSSIPSALYGCTEPHVSNRTRRIRDARRLVGFLSAPGREMSRKQSLGGTCLCTAQACLRVSTQQMIAFPAPQVPPHSGDKPLLSLNLRAEGTAPATLL